jgi:conjugal transfer pilus assembly protein TraU
MRARLRAVGCLLMSILSSSTTNARQCTGHFVNPVTDVCWKCLFPLSIGQSKVVSGALPDTDNASSPIGRCGTRVGLNIGYWEPVALADVTDTPYCLVNLGGHRLNLGLNSARGGRHVVGQGETTAFFNVHWYKYPLMMWLNIITSTGCRQGGDFDVAYLTELDPQWRDSEMNFVLNPEAALFGNPAAASSCAADSLSSSLQNKPIDALFWCAGAQGTHYPLTGFVNAPVSPIQTALLLTERMNFKLHRLMMIADSDGASPCFEQYKSMTPKSRYRYEMVNQVPDGKHCYPTGHTTLDWEGGKIKPHTPDQYGFLIWRKRNCVFL